MNDKSTIIVDNVSKMFLEYGIRGVTMDDIAQRLSISKKTLYTYFEDKKELVKAVVKIINCEIDKDFSSLDKDKFTAIEELFHFHEVHIRMIQTNNPAFIYDLKKYYPDLFSNFEKFKHEMIYNKFVSNLNRGIMEGLYRMDLDVDLITKINIIRLESMMDTHLFSPEEFMSANLCSELFKYIIYGITSDKGRKIVHKKFKIDKN